jgi:Nas2 N_terminal domain
MDIHSPSLPKAPTSNTAQSLNELLDEKTILEGTLSRLNAILESHGVGMFGCEEADADMSTPLIDRTGFPRADIDIAQSTLS